MDALQSREPFKDDAQSIFLHSANKHLLFDLLDTAGIDCLRAISSEMSDFEDAIMTETALCTEMDCIITRNIRDHSKSSVPVYLPSEFLTLLALEEENNLR